MAKTADDLNKMRDAELACLLAFWKPRLGLTDWDIVAVYKRGRDLECPAQGSCRPVPMLRKAHINIMDPIDYPDDTSFRQDVEVTLVHELLHCYHHASEPGTVAMLHEEQGVEATAKALVTLRRERTPA